LERAWRRIIVGVERVKGIGAEVKGKVTLD